MTPTPKPTQAPSLRTVIAEWREWLSKFRHHAGAPAVRALIEALELLDSRAAEPVASVPLTDEMLWALARCWYEDAPLFGKGWESLTGETRQQYAAKVRPWADAMLRAALASASPTEPSDPIAPVLDELETRVRRLVGAYNHAQNYLCGDGADPGAMQADGALAEAVVRLERMVPSLARFKNLDGLRAASPAPLSAHECGHCGERGHESEMCPLRSDQIKRGILCADCGKPTSQTFVHRCKCVRSPAERTET